MTTEKLQFVRQQLLAHRRKWNAICQATRLDPKTIRNVFRGGGHVPQAATIDLLWAHFQSNASSDPE